MVEYPRECHSASGEDRLPLATGVHQLITLQEGFACGSVRTNACMVHLNEYAAWTVACVAKCTARDCLFPAAGHLGVSDGKLASPLRLPLGKD